MRYIYSLLSRLALLFIFLPRIFYIIFFPLTIWLSYIPLKLLYPSSSIIANTLTVNTQQLAFVEACISPYAYYLLLALIMLTKDMKPLTRLKMMLIGSSFILLANITRIVILAVILLNFGYNSFSLLHLTFWYVLSTAFIILLWIILTNSFSIKSIPVYSDYRYLLENSSFKKKGLYKHR